MRVKISELKRGQIVWECERGMNAELRITRASHRTDNFNPSRKFGRGWRACARTVEGNHPVELFQSDLSSAYGPHLYTEPQYARLPKSTPSPAATPGGRTE